VQHSTFEEILNVLAMPRKRRFLFAHWEGGGNTPPILAVIRKLVARGHEVRLLSDACHKSEAEAVGASFTSWTRIPTRLDKSRESDPIKDWELQSPLALLARLRDRLFVGPALALAQDLLEELKRFPADVVVTSEMLLGVMAGAESARIPCVILCPNIYLFPLPGVPPFGPGLQPARGPLGRMRDAIIRNLSFRVFGKGTSAFNAARRALGLPPLAHPFVQVTRVTKHLILTSPAFDFPATSLPPYVLYTGPEIEDPAWVESWRSPWRHDDPRPLVLVAFSTTFQNHLPTLRRIVTALSTMPIRAVVTVGPALRADELPRTENVFVCASAPHSELLRYAAAVVTHAGHGTVIRSLVAAVPLLCMPMGRDQNDNAARVVARRVGLRLSNQASPRKIRKALLKILNSPSYRMRAEQLGRQIKEDARNSSTVEVLEQVGRDVVV
jgi:MGT family glycosyltransferase